MQKEADRIKRTIICKHPLEWDRAQYFDGERAKDRVFMRFGITGTDGLEYLRNTVAATDIWKDLSRMFRENSFWFAHPVYFINHLDMMGAFEFNPYFGEHKTTSGKDFKCLTNPGFAPVKPQGSITVEFRSGSDYYAGVTGLFNANYSQINKDRTAAKWTYYWHEGVDFEGKDGGAEIKSFIYGKLLQSGKSKTGMGGYAVIQDKANPKLFYVLVHLATVQDSPLEVIPGMVIGTVGRDEKGDAGFHLHLSHVLANRLEDVVNNEHRFPFWKRDVPAGSLDSQKVLNPFNHSETWNGRGHPEAE